MFHLTTSNILFAFFVLLLSTPFAYAQQELPADFPVMQNTGNKAVDNESYNNAKKAWIDANQDNYRQLGGQIQPKPSTNPDPNEVIKPDCITIKDLTIEVPADVATWAVTDANILDPDQQLAQNELAAQIDDFKNEMMSQKVTWKISDDNMLYMLEGGKHANHFRFEKVDDQLRLFPPSEELCNNKIKTYFFNTWTDSQIDIYIPAEDEGSTLVYQFSLTPESE